MEEKIRNLIEGEVLKLGVSIDSVEYVKEGQNYFLRIVIDRDEPIALPALLPLCFINGSSGIPSGLPTLNVPTIDIIKEFLESQRVKWSGKFHNYNTNCLQEMTAAERCNHSFVFLPQFFFNFLYKTFNYLFFCTSYSITFSVKFCH